jgi:hypothetical protein
MFRDRGISLDTTILSSFGIDGALHDMKDQAVRPERSIARVAVIGPSLDFTDKGFGYDFYSLQTLQPFTIYDSLIRLKLAEPERFKCCFRTIRSTGDKTIRSDHRHKCFPR